MILKRNSGDISAWFRLCASVYYAASRWLYSLMRKHCTIHIANPLAVMIVPVLILVFCGGLTLLEWLYETAFRICEAIRAVFGGLALGFLILVVGFNDPVALPEITVNIGLPVFVTMILPLLLYLILMKFDKKRTIQRIQNEQ